jgi:hypothetical protein
MFGGSGIWCGRWRRLAEKGVKTVCHAFDLLDLAIINCAELEDCPVGWGENGEWVWIKRAHPRLQFAIEEGGEVGVCMEI